MAHGELLVRLLTKVVWLIGLGLVCHLYVTHARADQLVQFESAAVRPTPFQMRMAKEQGKVAEAIPGTPLRGYLTRPEGEGPFPAIVLLHGCDGLGSHIKNDWPERLASWGYVVLVVDSFSTRGIHDTCHRILVDRVYDAYGALEFLSKFGFVDASRIAVMGFSAGGFATLQAVQLGGAERLMERKFAAAIAYYPGCSATNGDMAVPTLILIGELDDWSSAKKCQEMMTQRSGQGSSVQLIVYEGAYHAFDVAKLKDGISEFGHWLKYNAVATNQSVGAVRVFLQHVFGH